MELGRESEGGMEYVIEAFRPPRLFIACDWYEKKSWWFEEANGKLKCKLETNLFFVLCCETKDS